MSKNKGLLRVISGTIIGMSILTMAAPSLAVASQGTGYDQNGYNDNARIFNGWYACYVPTTDCHTNTWNAWLVMKWSSNWTPMASEPVGAWVTNHWQWYSNDLSSSDWYGFTSVTWTDHNTAPSAAYYVTESLKVQAVGDDSSAWATYQAGGAYDAGWGTYSDGVPMYVVFQDVVTIYSSSGSLIQTINIATVGPHGLGQPIF